MEKIFSEKNLQDSVETLLKKNDSCGIDGIFVSQFREYWQLNKDKIRDNLINGTYIPDAVQQCEILKKNGKNRTISKYTCTDRVITDVLKRELTPYWEGAFSAYSYAYQENKGVVEAAEQAAGYIEAGKDWVAVLDIESFFDHINLERLTAMLRLKIDNERLLNLLHKYLYIKVSEDFQQKRKTRGLIQGNPLSPLLSNVYMEKFDIYVEKKYSFCRFADDINIYCNTYEEAQAAFDDVKKYLKSSLGLDINVKKSGVFASVKRKYLGYEFYRKSGNKKVYIKKACREQKQYHNQWRSSAIQKIDRNYHIVNDGILTRKDFTILFENEDDKRYLPVETCGSINVNSHVTFSSSFFEYARTKQLQVNVFDKYGEYVGCFTTANHYDSAKTMLKQATIYNHAENRLLMAKTIELASLHNQRENLRYFHKHKKTDTLKAAIDWMTQCMGEMKACKSIEDLMLIEARAKQKYLAALDEMIGDEDFRFEKRTRRPPLNAVNALISFGNVFLYQRIATEIYKTALDIRIGFAHATNNRSESLNLDVAEIFKPIIVDRAIFTVIHNREITKDAHFSYEDNGGVYLNKEGKRIFIHELEHKLYQKLSVDGTSITYDTLIRNEIKKIVRYVQHGEKYKAYKYT